MTFTREARAKVLHHSIVNNSHCGDFLPVINHIRSLRLGLVSRVGRGTGRGPAAGADGYTEHLWLPCVTQYLSTESGGGAGDVQDVSIYCQSVLGIRVGWQVFCRTGTSPRGRNLPWGYSQLGGQSCGWHSMWPSWHPRPQTATE